MNISIPRFKVLAVAAALGCSLLAHAGGSILLGLSAMPHRNANTVPANGDVNPYGVAIAPPGSSRNGMIHTGDILVSNFNNSSNLQGTGTTIVDIAPSGRNSLIFGGPTGLGLTTALGVLNNGMVVVGNVPTTDGTSATVTNGSLLVLNSSGQVVATLADSTLLQGPWDLTIHQSGSTAQIFVSDVLSGTVTRIDTTVGPGSFSVVDMVQIASGYLHRSDPAALVVGPTGLVYDASQDVLYVASTGDNAIFSVAGAGSTILDGGVGTMVYSDNAHLRGPLGLVEAPNGHFITTNGDAVNGDPTQPSEMVEFTLAGGFVAQLPVDPTAQGGAFGIALAGGPNQITLAAVDDVTNTLKVWGTNLSSP